MIDLASGRKAYLIAALCLIPAAGLADGVDKARAPAASSMNWTGFYVGTHTGGAVGSADIADPFGPSIYGDKVTHPGPLAGFQLGYNRQSGRMVVGLEADVSLADLDGTNTCLAFSGFYVSANCHMKTKAFGSITGRAGWAVGTYGQTLLYGKGGVAWIHNEIDIENGNQYFGFRPDQIVSNTYTRWGWTVGGGIEHAVTPAISIRAEYDYMDFASASAGFPSSTFFPPLAIVPGGTTSVDDHLHVFKLGVNYRFGAGAGGWDHDRGSIKDAPMPVRMPGLEVEFGARYWYSTGKFQWDNDKPGSIIESRLTYDHLTGHSGELYGRVDGPHNVFVKGNVGVGSINSGKMNDEDWGILGAISYSNTVSHEDNGKLSYATSDIGLTWLRGPGYKVGSFVGYNYFAERADSHGCVQIANVLFPCLAAGDNRLIGTQDATWESVRLGMAAEVALTRGLRLTADAAWVPYTRFDGRDNHLLRTQTTYFDQEGTGRGMQIEAILSYDVTPNLSLGVGGRYWSMWTTDGSFTCTGCGAPGVTSNPPNPERVSTERYGVLLQGTYRFGVMDTVPLK